MKLKRLYQKHTNGDVILGDLPKHVKLQDDRIKWIPCGRENPNAIGVVKRGRTEYSIPLWPIVNGVEIQEMPLDGKHNFSTTLIEDCQHAGWLTQTDKHIVIHSANMGDVAFKIIKQPGRYCLHCGEKLEDDTLGVLARKHIEDHHAGEKSPDENNPSGYVCNNFYATEVEA